MQTTVAQSIPVVDRRRPYPAVRRGADVVERRRPAPVLLRDVDDLHDADFDGLLADQMVVGGSPARAGGADEVPAR